MFSKKILKPYVIAIVAMLIIGGASSLLYSAAGLHQPADSEHKEAPYGEITRVEAHGICKLVNNRSTDGLDLYVPLKSVFEWRDFRISAGENGINANTYLVNHMVNLQNCTTPEPPDVCPNLPGNQSTIPPGYRFVGVNCEPIPPNPPISGTAQGTIGIYLPSSYCMATGNAAVGAAITRVKGFDNSSGLWQGVKSDIDRVEAWSSTTKANAKSVVDSMVHNTTNGHTPNMYWGAINGQGLSGEKTINSQTFYWDTWVADGYPTDPCTQPGLLHQADVTINISGPF